MGSVAYSSRDGLVRVPVDLWGPEGPGYPLTFIVDTGTARTILAERIARRMGFRAERASGRTRVASVAGVEFGYLVRAPRIRALGWERVPFDVACHGFAAGDDVHGLLGADFLAGLRLTIDYAAGTIDLSAPQSPNSLGADDG